MGSRTSIIASEEFNNNNNNNTNNVYTTQTQTTQSASPVKSTPIKVPFKNAMKSPLKMFSPKKNSVVKKLFSPSSPENKLRDQLIRDEFCSSAAFPPSPPASPVLNRMRKGDMPEPRSPQFEVSEKIIGEGAFSKVRLATNLRTGQKVAVKSFPISQTMSKEQQEDLKMLRKERDMLKKLKHENIVQLYHTEEDTTKLSLYLQYISGGDMYNWICENGRAPEKVAKLLFKQMVDAVDFCHRNGICHRDIKLENFLLENGNRPVLIDFGFATQIPANGIFRDFPGSPAYACPEILQGIPYKGTAADVYALGVMLYTMIYYKYPFYSENRREMAHIVANDPVSFPSAISVSAELKDLLRRLLDKNSDFRPTIQEIRSHAWISELYPKQQQQQQVVEASKFVSVVAGSRYSVPVTSTYSSPKQQTQHQYQYQQAKSPLKCFQNNQVFSSILNVAAVDI